MGMIFQQFNLLAQRNVLQNVCFPMELAGASKKDAQNRAKELLALVGLPDKAKAYPAQLSGGQQQRVAFIRSLCQPFDFIFLDEPISHLDNENSVIMSALLMEEAGKQGAGVIVTSIGKHPELEYDETFRL